MFQKDLRFEHGGRQTWFLHRAPPNPVTPLLVDVILILQNDFEIKARSTSAQPGEPVVFWISKLLVAEYLISDVLWAWLLFLEQLIFASLLSRTWTS